MTQRRPLTDEEREARLNQKRAVYVPAAGARCAGIIDSGSGIVGETYGDQGQILLHYEGNRQGAENIKTFADRVLHAAGRQATRYPTTASLAVPSSDVVRVGTFDPFMGQVHVEAEAALAEWLGMQEVPADEVLTSEGIGRRRRDLQTALENPTLEPAARHWAEQEARKLDLR